MQKINIIGAGIGGLCAAIALRARGFEVQVYESAPKLRALGAGLSLSGNALKALSHIGLEQDIQRIGNSFGYLQILSHKGRVITQTDALKMAEKFGAGNFAVHRAELQDMLLSYLPETILHLGKKCMKTEQDGGEVRSVFEDGSSATADALLAFDGIHSAVRQQLLPQVKLRYAGYTCWRAVIQQEPENFDSRLFTETWGTQGRFGIVPLSGQRIYWFATCNASRQDERMRCFGVKDLLQHFRGYHRSVTDVLELTTDDQLIWNDILDFAPVEQYAFGRVLLAGDAAHATTPNMGQGACMAIEDAVVAANCLSAGTGVEAAFRDFEQKRRKRAQYIVNTSYQLGSIAQYQHPVLLGIRNSLFRMMPESMKEKQLKFLYKVEF